MASSGHVLANRGATIVRILLVNLPHDRRETMFPLELAGIAAVLKTQGHEVDGFDFGADRGGSWPAVADSYDVILFTATSSTYNRVRDLVRELGPTERRLTIVGGPYATLYPDEVLAEPAVDAVILGEGERVAGGVIRSWQQNEPESLSGAVWQKRWTDRGLLSNRDPRRIDQLGQLPLCDRTVFAIEDYTGMATRRARYTQIVATRGSDHADAQSPLGRLLPGGRRTRPVEHVVEEMTILRDRFGISELHFEDDGLFEDPDYVMDLCRLIRSELPGVAWQCPNGNRPGDLHAEMLEELAAAGCYRIYLQLDSPDAEAMRLLKRCWDPAVIGPLTEEAHRVGIELGGYFTLGLPGESPSQMQATVRFAVDSGLAWAQFTPFGFAAGSELYGLREDLSPRLPPEPLVRRIIRKAYWRFYGSRGRWRVVLRNLNRRNAVQLLWRAYGKLVHGRPGP